MKDSSRYHVIGLWRVWERGGKVSNPQERAPDVLIERLALTLDYEPTAGEVEKAIAEADRDMARLPKHELHEHFASIVAGDFGWDAMRQRSIWLENTMSRHTRTEQTSVALHIYGLGVWSQRVMTLN